MDDSWIFFYGFFFHTGLCWSSITLSLGWHVLLQPKTASPACLCTWLCWSRCTMPYWTCFSCVDRLEPACASFSHQRAAELFSCCPVDIDVMVKNRIMLYRIFQRLQYDEFKWGNRLFFYIRRNLEQPVHFERVEKHPSIPDAKSSRPAPLSICEWNQWRRYFFVTPVKGRIPTSLHDSMLRNQQTGMKTQTQEFLYRTAL